jgi:hypothetical protein
MPTSTLPVIADALSVTASNAAYDTGVIIGYVGTFLCIGLVLYRRHRR